MAVTLSDLIAEVESFVYGYFNDRDKVTSLTGTLDSTATTLTVAESEQIDRGFVEIGYELMATLGRSGTTGTVALHPWGRGQRGTLAAAHATGEKVTVNPRFPRSWIRTEINNTIANLYPELYAVSSSYSLTYSPVQVVYPLPADVEGVLQVAVDSIGPTKAWYQVSRYRFDYSAATTEFPTGKSLALLQGFTPGQAIQVIYRKQFGQLNADADTLTQVGVDDSWRDLIKLMVAARMLMGLDSSRLQTTSVEAGNRSSQVQVGSAAQVARQVMAMATSRLEQERRLLLNRYPTVQQLRG